MDGWVWAVVMVTISVVLSGIIATYIAHLRHRRYRSQQHHGGTARDGREDRSRQSS